MTNRVQKKPNSRRGVMEQLEGLTGIARAHGMCALVGHSHIVHPGGRCSRCLVPTGYVEAQTFVIGSPRTMANRAKFKAMSWQDKKYAPTNPFGEL